MSARPFGLFAMSVLCLRYLSAWLLHVMTLFSVHLRHFHCAADFCAPHRHIHDLGNKKGTGSDPNRTEPYFLIRKGGERKEKVENVDFPIALLLLLFIFMFYFLSSANQDKCERLVFQPP